MRLQQGEQYLHIVVYDADEFTSAVLKTGNNR